MARGGDSLVKAESSPVVAICCMLALLLMLLAAATGNLPQSPKSTSATNVVTVGK